MHNPLAVLTGPTIAPEAAGGVMTTALLQAKTCRSQKIWQLL